MTDPDPDETIWLEMEAKHVKDLYDILDYINRTDDTPEWSESEFLEAALAEALTENRGSAFDWYQDLTDETAVYPSTGVAAMDEDTPDGEEPHPVDLDTGVLYTALGLNGEAGEVAEKIKKDLRGDDPEAPLDIGDELGDVLWYLARLCVELDYSFDAIARRNASKLSDRKDRDVLKGSGDDR